MKYKSPPRASWPPYRTYTPLRRSFSTGGLLLLLVAFTLSACNSTYPLTPRAPAISPTAPPSPAGLVEPIPFTPTLPAPTPVLPTALPPTPIPPTLAPTAAPLAVRFAVIGDYGGGGQEAADVAALVKSWQPDIVITTGDNNYPDGAAETIDHNIGQFYASFIYPYRGQFGPGADANRFFPTLGNHDYGVPGAQPYLDYFTLPGNERYYDFTWGPVHFFALNGDPNEPDGVGASSVQAAWLQERLAAATLPWKVVYVHQPPYASGYQGSVDWMRWPFAEWGATSVLAGHDHIYERLLVDGLPYFVNGVGGGAIYNLEAPLEFTQFRYNSDWGAMLVTATETEMSFEFYNRRGELIDSYTQTRP